MATELVPRSREHLRAPLGEWYRPGIDNAIYERALRKCRDSNASLAKILPQDDVLLLLGTSKSPGLTVVNAQAVKSFIEDNANHAKGKIDGSKIKWLSSFVNNVARFTLNIQDIITPLVSQNPHCAIAFGCVMVIFKWVIIKQQKQEKVVEIFGRLVRITGLLETCNVLYPTNRMREKLAQTYMDILDLLVRATEYCAIDRISKIVDALTASEKYNFDTGLQKVESSWKTLRILIQIATSAMQMDIHELLQNQAAKADSLADQSQYMVSEIIRLRSSYDALLFAQTRMQSLEVRNRSDLLINALLPSNRTMTEELQAWEGREFRLSPKDHWEVNGVLDCLKEWNSLMQASILAVFGPTSERDSWVTEFTLDTIKAFQVQSELIAFVMCDRPNNEHLTPVILIKTIISQILEQKPGLVLEKPELFSCRVFQRATEFTSACGLLEHVIAKVDRIAILIDRIDHCQWESSDPKADILGFLVRLIRKYGKSTKVIITSTDLPPDELPLHHPISICKIATRKPLSRTPYRRPFRYVKLSLPAQDTDFVSIDYHGRKNPSVILEQHWVDIKRYAQVLWRSMADGVGFGTTARGEELVIRKDYRVSPAGMLDNVSDDINLGFKDRL
ncbi:hypothetical protein EV356DRAFT_528142 [Viridothelium virens]|uniref:Fungal STAND N-terminal Goodbye domain-containing protein n=1 Tax=Viridothelium virens TaxID=1048519 RepID=A0A6A6HQ26_VIRVR|nr:hypothetical protein EV356DRAFT_528142 [Viridothelium virens]